jgi:CheY-like chemotaxis protein
VLSTLLERMGMEVDVASNGKEGVDKALEKSYDFIFMDLEMPVMDGWQAMSILRERLPDTGPVIVAHSAAGNADIAIRARACGAHAFLPKPARAGAIAKLIHSQDSRPAREAAK